MLRLNRRAQAIVEYIIVLAVAAGACIALFSYVRLFVYDKINAVSAER